MVSASGDASLRLIYAQRGRRGQHRPDPVVQGLLQGVPVPGEQHGRRQALRRLVPVRPERAARQHEEVREARRRWAAIYDPKNKGKISIPDNPIQIADAALYLSKMKPSLGITDPYELTKAQLAAAVALLKQQRPLVKKYWGLASDQIDLFKNGGSTIGASWPYQVTRARRRRRCRWPR